MLLNAAFAVNTLAGLAFLAVGIALLVQRPPRPGIMAFASFAVVSGAQQALGNVGSALEGARILVTLSWPFLAVGSIALTVAAAEYAHRSSFRWALPFMATGVAGALLFMVAPERMLAPNRGLADAGLFLWSQTHHLAFAVAVLLLEGAHRRARTPERRAEALILLVSVLPFMAYTAGVGFSVFSRMFVGSAPLYSVAVDAGYVVTFGLSIAVVAGVAAALWRSTDRAARWTAVAVVGVTVVGLVQPFLVSGLILFGGLLRILAALLLGYGLLKFGLFDVDVRLKVALERGTLLALFGGLFFAVEEGAENFVSDVYGTAAGIGAALLMLLALNPLRAWTARLADRVFPHVHATPDYEQKRRVGVYRAAWEAAVSNDGVITHRERAMLETLIRELDIDPEVAYAIERGTPLPDASPPKPSPS